MYLIKHNESKKQHSNFLEKEENLIWSHSGVSYTCCFSYVICEHIFPNLYVCL